MADAHLVKQGSMKPVDMLKTKTPPEGVAVGEVVHMHGLGSASKQSALSSWVAVVTMSAMSGAFHLYVGAMMFFWVPWVRIVLLLFLLSLVMPATRWESFRYNWIFQTWRDYVKLSFITEHVLDPKDDKSYLCCCVQHGVVPYATMAGAALDERLFPDRNKYVVVSAYLFKLPIIRQIVGWMGGISASRSNIIELLRPGRGLVFLYQGGLAEMCAGPSSKERVFLKKRKGFVRIAVEGGHSLFPMYFLGQSEFLSLWSPGFLSGLSRWIRAPVGFLYGRYGLPVPRHREVLVIAGKPIDTGAPMSTNDPNFEQRVDEVHKHFIAEVERIFDEYKDRYGWGHKELEVL